MFAEVAVALLSVHSQGSISGFVHSALPESEQTSRLLIQQALASFSVNMLQPSTSTQSESAVYDAVIVLDNSTDKPPAGSRLVEPWRLVTVESEVDDLSLLIKLNNKIQSLTMKMGFHNPVLSAAQFYKALSDEIRLKTLLLLVIEPELCVCELMVALEQESQPKVSRHLAQLKKLGILRDVKRKQWVFYSLNPALPIWMKQILNSTVIREPEAISKELNRLENMGDRPSRITSCCN